MKKVYIKTKTRFSKTYKIKNIKKKKILYIINSKNKF